MATVSWRGGAPTQAQVDGWTFGGTWETSDLVLLTIGSKTVSVTAGSTTTTTVVDNVVTAWNALSSALYPEFAQYTASRSSSDFRLTSDTAGVPIGTVSITTTESNGDAADAQTISSQTAVTVNRGPNDWASPMNWSGGAVPVNSDDVVIEDTDDDILYGLDQNAVDLTSLTIRRFSGTIGLPLIASNTAGVEYYQWLQKDLKIGFTTLTFDAPDCLFANIDGDSTAFTANVHNTGTSTDDTRYALRLRGTSTSNVLNMLGGECDFAYQAGEASALATIRTGYINSPETDVKLRVGSGVSTMTTINVNGGLVELNSNSVTITQTAGELSLMGTMTVTTLNLDGGTCYYRSSGTCTTANVGSGGLLDFSRDVRTRTVTTCNVFTGSAYSDPFKTVTWTNGIDYERCSLDEVTGNLGNHFKITPAAAS